MTEDGTDEDQSPIPANDNRRPDEQDGSITTDRAARLDALVLSIARLIGRQMAREDFEKAMSAANDNLPKSGNKPGFPEQTSGPDSGEDHSDS